MKTCRLLRLPEVIEITGLGAGYDLSLYPRRPLSAAAANQPTRQWLARR